MGSLKPPSQKPPPGSAPPPADARASQRSTAGRAIDDPSFLLPEIIPFAPGSGPFRIKGWGNR